MDGMPLRFFARSIFFTLILTLVACGQMASEKVSVPGAKSGSTGSSGSNPSPSTGVVNSAGFFLSAYGTQNSSSVKYIHQADASYGSDIGTTNFSSSCKIAYGSASGGDLTCVAEIEELDLFFDTLNIQYHVPSSMCTYVSVRPYWFYSFAPGTGPTVVSHEILASGAINDVLNTSNGTPTCQYDYSNYNGANCCIGTYTHTVTTYTSTSSFTQTTTTGSWGGMVGNCAAGAGKEYKTTTASLVPVNKLLYVSGTGVNDVISITAPYDNVYNNRALRSNVWAANFYKPSDHTGGMPISMQDPSAVTPSSALNSPSDTYEFRCMDAANETVQRIRLFVREWNEEGQLVEGGDPDTSGPEPSYPTYDINDYSDWLDFGDTYPASNL